VGGTWEPVDGSGGLGRLHDGGEAAVIRHDVALRAAVARVPVYEAVRGWHLPAAPTAGTSTASCASTSSSGTTPTASSAPPLSLERGLDGSVDERLDVHDACGTGESEVVCVGYRGVVTHLHDHGVIRAGGAWRCVEAVAVVVLDGCDDGVDLCRCSAEAVHLE
jgi:hypothetical protein